MNNNQTLAPLALRISLAVTLLSSVASRLCFWGEQSSGWENFMAYTAEINSFASDYIIPFLAVSATVLETLLGLLLLAGYKTRLAASGTAILILLFALAMTLSFGLKAPLDYSVFVFSAASWVLAILPASSAWSVDALFITKTTSQQQL